MPLANLWVMRAVLEANMLQFNHPPSQNNRRPDWRAA